jgi:hypothetical protein
MEITIAFPIHKEQQHFNYPNNNSIPNTKYNNIIPTTQITTSFPIHKQHQHSVVICVSAVISFVYRGYYSLLSGMIGQLVNLLEFGAHFLSDHK